VYRLQGTVAASPPFGGAQIDLQPSHPRVAILAAPMLPDVYGSNILLEFKTCLFISWPASSEHISLSLGESLSVLWLEQAYWQLGRCLLLGNSNQFKFI